MKEKRNEEGKKIRRRRKGGGRTARPVGVVTPVKDPRPKRCHYPIPISHQRFVLCVGGGEFVLRRGSVVLTAGVLRAWTLLIELRY